MPPLPFRPLQSADTTSPRELERYLRELERVVGDLHSQLQSMKQTNTRGYSNTGTDTNTSSTTQSGSTRLTMEDLRLIQRELQAGGSAELDLTDLVGLQAESTDVRFPIVTTAPDPYSAPYDAYILQTGSNYVLYQINRAVNPPVAIAITAAASPHDILSTIHSDSLAGTVVRGDLIVGNSTPKWARLAMGAANKLLRVNRAGTDPEWGVQYGCRAYHNAAQSINDATLTALNLNTESYDQGSLHDTAVNNPRITIPTDGAGIWILGGQIHYAANAAGARAALIYRNGVTQESYAQATNAGAADVVGVVTIAAVSAAAADYFELVALQNSGGALNTVANRTVFFAHMLMPL